MKKSLVLVPLLFVVAVLLTGAWPRSKPIPTDQTEVDFVPQIIALECASLEGKITARQLLDKAIENLSGDRTSWLKTKFKQTMQDAHSSFVASGVLQRGPNHCARLELQVMTDGVSSRLLVVSDGKVLAEERTIVNAAPKIECNSLPEGDPAKRNVSALAREAFLTGKGCGGPLSVLQQLQPRLQNLKLQTGLLRGEAVIRVKGELPADNIPSFALTTVPLQFCWLYFDAKTIWPCRIEWWGTDQSKTLRSIMQVEFHDAQTNQSLSPEECARTFSYQPAMANSE